MFNIRKNKTQIFNLNKVNQISSWMGKKNKWFKLKELCSNFWKKKNRINPFVVEQNSLPDVIDMMLNTTPEQEAEYQQKVLKMINYMFHPYNETKIEENEFKYTHNNEPEKFYYKVKEIIMTPEEYQVYLEKKDLNKKLSNNFKTRVKNKRLKI